MAGTDPGAPFQRIEELEQENEVLRERLEQAEDDIERLRRENEQLRRELKAAGRGSRHGKRKPKADPKRPGRKAGQGSFTYRKAPADRGASDEPPIEVPVTVGQCPCCGGELRYERTDEATVTDMPQASQPEVKSYAVEVRRCDRCGQRVRGQHPDVAPDQYGATAHRVGPRVKAAAHVVHYGMGVPVRRLAAILREFAGIEVTQSADQRRRSRAGLIRIRLTVLLRLWSTGRVEEVGGGDRKCLPGAACRSGHRAGGLHR